MRRHDHCTANGLFLSLVEQTLENVIKNADIPLILLSLRAGNFTLWPIVVNT